MRHLRVLVADDHALMRGALAAALDGAPGFEVVAEAASGAQVLPLVERTSPDVVLLDVRMPQLDGLACLERLRHHHPEVSAVMLSAVDDAATIERALGSGAAGYIHKSINPVDLPEAIRRAVDGSLVIERAGRNCRPQPAADEAGLSPREAAVLSELARGRSNAEIARALSLSHQTIKFHLRNIYRKLDVQTRAEAVHYAYAHHLVVG